MDGVLPSVAPENKDNYYIFVVEEYIPKWIKNKD
jgi:hypothetical protein